MRLLTHTVAAHEDGLTVKQLLRSLWHIDHSLLSRLKFRSAITLNGAPVTVRAVARAGGKPAGLCGKRIGLPAGRAVRG